MEHQICLTRHASLTANPVGRAYHYPAPEQWQMSAGAPGFCINKLTGNVRDVDWGEYQDTILKG